MFSHVLYSIIGLPLYASKATRNLLKFIKTITDYLLTFNNMLIIMLPTTRCDKVYNYYDWPGI